MDKSISIATDAEGEPASATTNVDGFVKNNDSGNSSQIEVPSCNGEIEEEESHMTDEIRDLITSTLHLPEQQSDINSKNVSKDTINDGTSDKMTRQVTDVTDNLGNASSENNASEQSNAQRKQVVEEEVITLSSDSEVEYDEDTSRSDSEEEEDGEEEEYDEELEDESVGGVMHPRQLSSSISISLVGNDGAPKKQGVTEVISLTSSDNDSDVEESGTSVIKATTRKLTVENCSKKPDPEESLDVELESEENPKVLKADENQMDSLENSSECSLPTLQAPSDPDEPDAKKIKTDEGNTDKHYDLTICGSEAIITNSPVYQINDRSEEKECSLTSPTSNGLGMQLKELEKTTPRTSPMKKYKTTVESLSPAKKPQQSNQNPVLVGKTDTALALTSAELDSLKTLEEHILVGAQLIKKKGEEEVDLSDDENSSFVQMEVLEKSYLDTFKRGTQSLKVVGARSARKKIRIPIETVSEHLEIQQELEAFVNKREWEWDPPSYVDILGVVKKVASQKSPRIDAEAIAKRVSQYLSKKFKLYRKQEFDSSWPAPSSADPALNSPELAAKLAENKKLEKEIPRIEFTRRPGTENLDTPMVVTEEPESEGNSAVTDELSTNSLEEKTNENSIPGQSFSSTSTENVPLTDGVVTP